MEFSEQISKWATGDALQGKLMILVGAVALVSSIIIFRGDNSILKGMLIPLGLVILIGLGYGSFLGFTREAHASKAIEMYQKNPEMAISQEFKKAQTDDGNYTMIKKLWPILMIISAVLLFFFHGDYARGLLIGFLLVFVIGLILDTLLHQRLQPYLNFLNEISG